MRRLLPSLLCSWLALVAAAPARAQGMDREVVSIRNDFVYGKYEEALARAKERINRGGLNDEALVELHKIAGLSSHYLGRGGEAEVHFQSLLRIDPDFSLDPFLVPPNAVSLFEKLRKELGRELDVIRERRRTLAELAAREREQREKNAREAEELQRRMEALPRRTVERTVQQRSFIVNLFPFGAGQLLQGRQGLGTVLAVTEGVTAATSVIAYIALGTLFEPVPRSVNGFETPDGQWTFTEYGIPRAREREALTWRATMVASGALFYALYLYGVLDALYHHEDQVVTERVVDDSSTVGPLGTRPRAPHFTLTPFVFSSAHGGGGGLTLTF